MTSKKRINKYKQLEKAGSMNAQDQVPASFRRNRRHSWFGNLNSSGDVGSNTNGFDRRKSFKHQLSFDALDLKTNLNSEHVNRPPMIEKAAQVFGFGSDTVSVWGL